MVYWGVLSDSIWVVDVASFPFNASGLDRVTSIGLCAISVVGVRYDRVLYFILASHLAWKCRYNSYLDVFDCGISVMVTSSYWKI